MLQLTNAPVYLPWNTSQLPFGDVLGGITCTSAAPGVVTSVGYTPKLNDAVSLTFTAGGSIPTGLTAGTTYYVVSPSGQTFSLSATKGGGAITTSSTGANLILHLLSGQFDGTTQPFDSGGSAVCINMTAGSLVLQGAPDASVATAAGFPGYPTGPGTYATIATIPALSMAMVTLSADWIRVSTAANLWLLQN
jgi:hypothetical protein